MVDEEKEKWQMYLRNLKELRDARAHSAGDVVAGVFKECKGDDIMCCVPRSENAKLPSKSTPGSAAYDLYAACDLVVEAHKNTVVPLDLTVEMPEGYHGLILPRSGLAVDNMIAIGGGVIDNDYRGNVKVVLFNHGD